MTALTEAERAKLTEELGGSAVVEHYEALIRDYIASHTAIDGKVAAKAKFRNLAATIRVWYRRDHPPKPGYIAQPEKRKPETKAEREARAGAILRDLIRQRNQWIAARDGHNEFIRLEAFPCQDRGCRYHGEPAVLPTLSEIIQRIEGEL